MTAVEDENAHTSLNATHDATRRSWIASAQGSAFPLQNLPHGVFKHGAEPARGGVAIGDQIFDMQAATQLKLFSGELLEIAHAASAATLNDFLAMGPDAAGKLRLRIFELLDQSSSTLAQQRAQLLRPMSQAQMQLPVISRGFSDFCTSIPHVTAHRRARPGRPLHPALKHLPVGYAARSSSIVVSGTRVLRPSGQSLNEHQQVQFAPSRRLDFELEVGAFVTGGNDLGRPIPISQADRYIFGYALLNDWSARDLQGFESLLGPFLGKSFCTSLSPWLITQEALRPFRCAPLPRPAGDPHALPHLSNAAHAAHGALDVKLQAYLSTQRMRDAGLQPKLITDSNLLHLYWTLPQMVAHHSSNGCNLENGDLLGSGTVSGPEEHQAACLWEITGGSLPIDLPNGEQRVWLEDGDELMLTGYAERDGYARIGFGTCTGRIMQAAD